MQQSSLDILADLLQRYVGEIGRSAHSYAEVCNRGAPSAEDLVGLLLFWRWHSINSLWDPAEAEDVSYSYRCSACYVRRRRILAGPQQTKTYAVERERWKFVVAADIAIVCAGGISAAPNCGPRAWRRNRRPLLSWLSSSLVHEKLVSRFRSLVESTAQLWEPRTPHD